MNILVINWRSIKDPLSGGAEVATFEHTRRWVKNHNANVTWLSPRYNSSISQESFEGVQFKYIGVPLGTSSFRLLFTYPIFYLLAMINYLLRYKKTSDIVIDQVHGFPYLTPLYVRKPIFVYVHEIAGDIWDTMFKFPINILGKIIEKLIFLPYKKSHFIVVSKSTFSDIEKMGINEKNITIVPNGVSTRLLTKIPEKESDLTILFLNRVVKMKGIERCLEAFSYVVKTKPNAVLKVAGSISPSYQKYLEDKVRDLGLGDSVTFLGRVSEELKIELLGSSHVLVNPSYKEGWGLVNIEANTQGTPAVAFSVPGNVDSIINGVNGYIVSDDDLEGMANALIKASDNVSLRKSALEHSAGYNWDVVASKFYNVFQEAYEK